MNHEDELVAWLRTLQAGDSLGLPGDDAAVLGRGATARALTVDQQIAGIHVPADLDAAVWARRLLAVNLSDLAAMGAQPTAALLTLAVPPAFPTRPFLAALVTACHRRGTQLIGGDVARAPTAVTTLTAIGSRPAGGRWLARSAARPGDRLWLGGPVGLSALGQRLVARGSRLRANRPTLVGLPSLSSVLERLARRALRRHLEPSPQLDLGHWLGRRKRAAAIDISDGLARDLHRLCMASGVGARLDRGALPLTRAFNTLAETLGEDPLSLALGGGEDYCLLFSLPGNDEPPTLFGARPIGWIIDGGEVELVDGSRRTPLPPTGWDHLSG